MPTPTIQSKLAVLHSTDGVVDLFKIDLAVLGGPTFFFSPQCYEDGSNLSWGGQTFNLLPVGMDNLEHKTSNSALPQPTLVISGVNGPLLQYVVALGDITGAAVTHWKTLVSYLDGGANPDTTQFIGPEVWRIFQNTVLSNNQLQFTLSSPLDLPGMMFPVRQILKDPGINPGGIYFPGVSPYRI
jgi:lambda family phage minor tail protein L